MSLERASRALCTPRAAQQRALCGGAAHHEHHDSRVGGFGDDVDQRALDEVDVRHAHAQRSEDDPEERQCCERAAA